MLKEPATAKPAPDAGRLAIRRRTHSHGFNMLRFAASSILILATAGTALAESQQCYPRIGRISFQYEGQCPGSEIKWVIFENDLGAFGRNCKDEPWSYSRAQRAYYNHKSQTVLPMTDCPPGRQTGGLVSR